MELAAEEAEKREFQYICAINSDLIPYGDFSEKFRNRFNSFVKIEFTDATDDGGLFGFRF
jgi:uncharacterized protein YydD (DUF2326 family)